MPGVKKKGGIVVIDGPDGTGKATTAKLVLELCQTRKPLGAVKFLSESFPNYADFYGRQIRAYLDGDAATLEQRVPAQIRQDPYCASLPYAADRYQTYKKVMKPQLDRGNWYILDRFISSNMAFQGAKITEPRAKEQFLRRLTELEHGYFNLPTPDLVIILTLLEPIRCQRTEGRLRDHLQKSDNLSGKISRHDLHEQDLTYMTQVAVEYKALARKLNWQIVDCVEGNRELTPEEVAEKVYQAILLKLLGN